MRQYSGLERLEAALVEMGQGMSYAATPNFEPKVLAALERARGARPRPVPALRVATPRLILIIALALALLAAVAASTYYVGVRLVGFVPGVGYVELDETLILAEPVSVEQGGLTVQVNQVVANPNRTRILYSVSPFFPLPDEGEPYNPYNLPVDPGPSYEPMLLLSNGRVLSAGGAGWGFIDSADPNETRAGFVATGGDIDFTALPEGVNEVTLVLNCIPVQPEEGGPQKACIHGPWRVALRLVPATERFSGLLFQPYDPQASASANGVTMRVQRVAHGDQETAVEVQFEWSEADGPPRPFLHGRYSSLLKDNLGVRYLQHGWGVGGVTEMVCWFCSNVITKDTATGQVMTEVQTLTYPPLSNQARELTLTIEALEFTLSASVEFSIDLGPDPQVGQTWALDQALQVSGFEVHLLEARLIEAEGHFWLELYLETEQLADSWLEAFGSNVAASPFDAPSIIQDWIMSGGEKAVVGSRGFPMAFGTVAMPRGRQPFRIDFAAIGLRGPWQVTWPIPAPD